MARASRRRSRRFLLKKLLPIIFFLVAVLAWSMLPAGERSKYNRGRQRPVQRRREAVQRVDERKAFDAVVFRVVDGDTVDVRAVDGAETRLRLYGIDAPESSQEFGPDARRYVSSRILKRQVRVQGRYNDKYGRLVATIYVNGEDFSLELLRNGIVWHYVQYCDDPAYASAQRRARSSGVGLWGGSSPQAPWEFRREHPWRGTKKK